MTPDCEGPSTDQQRTEEQGSDVSRNGRNFFQDVAGEVVSQNRIKWVAHCTAYGKRSRL